MTARIAMALALAGALVTGARAAHAADTLESLVMTGPAENRIDLVITGDGYTAAQGDLFRQHAQDLVDEMFAGAPLAGYQGAFNISLVVTESAQSGADHPSQGIAVDTYFGGYFDCANIERLTCADNTKVATVVMGLAPETDFIVLILNDTQYGGSGGSIAIVSAHELAVDILVHELGHTISGLADEYTTPYPGYPPGDPEPNVDFDASFDLIKWNHWIEDGTPLPTSVGDATGPVTPIGAYEGARYLDTGIHRPGPDCGMRTLGVEYCSVCQEAQVISYYEIVSPLDGVSPAPGSVTVKRGTAEEPTTFAVETPAVDSLVVQWLVDGEPVATGPELALDAAELELALGSHTLEVVVGDQTPLVRRDPNALMTASQMWTLEVEEGESLPDAGPQVGGDGGSGGGDDLSTAGCGCRTGGQGGAGAWLLALVGLVAARRRRAARPTT